MPVESTEAKEGKLQWTKISLLLMVNMHLLCIYQLASTLGGQASLQRDIPQCGQAIKRVCFSAVIAHHH